MSEIKSGMNVMGEPIPTKRRSKAFETCVEIGLDSKEAWECVEGMAKKLESDYPYKAQEHALEYIDLVGFYRVTAVLLAEPIVVSHETNREKQEPIDSSDLPMDKV